MNNFVKILKIAGILDGANANNLCYGISCSLEKGVKVILIDLQNVDSINSQGLFGLATALKTVRSSGKKLCLCSLNQQLKMVFEMSRMEQFLKFLLIRMSFITI